MHVLLLIPRNSNNKKRRFDFRVVLKILRGQIQSCVDDVNSLHDSVEVKNLGRIHCSLIEFSLVRSGLILFRFIFEMILTDSIHTKPHICVYIYMKQIDWQLPGATDGHGQKASASALEAEGWPLLLRAPKAEQKHVGWCLRLQDCLATAESVLTSHGSHLVLGAAPLLEQEAAPGASLKPGALLGTALDVHLQSWQLREGLLPRCL